MKKTAIPLLVLVACFTFTNLANPAVSAFAKNKEQIVYSYIAAFNAREIDEMLEMVTDDVQWLSVEGDSVSLEANGKKALRRSMVEYFKSCTICKSRLAHTFSTSGRVAALEVASFETSKGVQEQRSVSLYEFSNGFIKRVYYFPAEQ